MVNRVLLMGRLTRDPQLASTPGGEQVCNFSLALSEGSKNGHDKRTVFVDCAIWKKAAVALAQYKRKGDLIFVEGKLNLSEWIDKQTQQKRSKLTVTAFSVQFVNEATASRPSEASPPPQEELGEDWS